jgi:hypothetical protein
MLYLNHNDISKIDEKCVKQNGNLEDKNKAKYKQ